MIITVISSGLSRLGARCLESVNGQVGVVVDHRVVSVDQQVPRLTKIENLRACIADLPADRIVALVDLDDWLTDERALSLVAELHQAGAWVTYGSFTYADGRPGFAGAYAPGESVRTSRWRATHLKTFRAGLFRAIDSDDLCFRGTWIDRADDVAFMLPMLEMAGHERAVYIDRPLYCYDLSTSFEFSASEDERRHEKEIHAYVRSLPPYARLDALS